MKKFVCVLLFTIITSLLIGCGGNNNDGNAKGSTIDVADVFAEIKNEIAAERDGEMSGLIDVDLLHHEEEPLADMIIQETGLTDEYIAEGYLLASAMNVNADTIILIEAKEASQIPLVEEKLEAYNEAQYNIWEMYLPDQFEKVKNTIIETKGNYIIYITYENPEKMKDIFTNAFKLI